MIARVLADVRRVRAWLAWLRLVAADDIAGAEALFAECADPLLRVTSLDPSEVGRQQSEGAAILDVVRWLECSGWYGEDGGYLQRYAAWLLRARAAYEREVQVPS